MLNEVLLPVQDRNKIAPAMGAILYLSYLSNPVLVPLPLPAI